MAYIGTPGVPVRRSRSLTMSNDFPRRPPGRRPARVPCHKKVTPLCLAPPLQKFVGWLTILGGTLLFTSNMDRLFSFMTTGGGFAGYKQQLELDKKAKAKMHK